MREGVSRPLYHPPRSRSSTCGHEGHRAEMEYLRQEHGTVLSSRVAAPGSRRSAARSPPRGRREKAGIVHRDQTGKCCLMTTARSRSPIRISHAVGDVP